MIASISKPPAVRKPFIGVASPARVVPSSLAINLASAPFQRERSRIVALSLLCAALTCSFIVITLLVSERHSAASILKRSNATDSAMLSQAQANQTRLSALLAKPENAAVFSVSVLLNKLVARRGVSWTRVFRDVGSVLPNNIRLIGMRLPQIPSEDASGVNHVQLDLLLGTEKPAAIVDLLKRLQGSKVFGAAQVLAQQPATKDDKLYRFRITVAYEQKL